MITVQKLCKAFDKTTVLDGLNCNIEDGSVYGLVGANGAGKSTFLRVLSGIYQADKGSVMIDGQEVFDNVDVKQNVCFVSDDFYFMKGATVQAVGELYALLYPHFDMAFYRDCADQLKLKWNNRISTFSKGMRRQVSLICALATKCKYLFFDETFDGLDPVVRNYMKKLICSAVIENGGTVIMTSHNLRELEDVCDHLGILYQGGILFEGDVNNIKTNICKVQVALSKETLDGLLKDFAVLNRKEVGSISQLILRADAETVKGLLMTASPALLDVLPLTLEEVFIYEMEVLGYAFKDFGIE